MNRKRRFSCLVALFCWALVASGQVTGSRKFHAVPKPLRDRLVARFNLYVEYERMRQHEKLWDLLSQAYVANQKLTRDKYLRYRPKDILLEFKPRAVSKSYIPGTVNVFEIHGVAKFQRGNEVVTADRLLEARLQDNEWYSSDWLQIVD
jgi:hypothetical protein